MSIVHISSIGEQPSLSELHHLVVPGPKEVKVIQTVATKWKKLALELGFDLSVIDSIGSRYSDSEEDCKYMLRKWLMRHDATVSWEVLMTALDNIGLNSIAHDLKKGKINGFDSFTHFGWCAGEICSAKNKHSYMVQIFSSHCHTTGNVIADVISLVYTRSVVSHTTTSCKQMWLTVGMNINDGS